MQQLIQIMWVHYAVKFMSVWPLKVRDTFSVTVIILLIITQLMKRYKNSIKNCRSTAVVTVGFVKTD